MTDLKILTRAAEGALGSPWWYLLETALQRAEEATGASLADAAVLGDTEA
jgi:hypothetical protein